MCIRDRAVSVGDLVRIFTFGQGQSTMVELTLPDDSPYAGKRVGDVPWPNDSVLVGIIREDHPIAPGRDDSLEAHDELLFLATPQVEDALQSMLLHMRGGKEQQLVVSLKRVIAAGRDRVVFPDDSHQDAVVGPRDVPNALAGVRAVVRKGELDHRGLALSEGEDAHQVADADCSVSYTHLRAHETVLDLVC